MKKLFIQFLNRNKAYGVFVTNLEAKYPGQNNIINTFLQGIDTAKQWGCVFENAFPWPGAPSIQYWRDLSIKWKNVVIENRPKEIVIKEVKVEKVISLSKARTVEAILITTLKTGDSFYSHKVDGTISALAMYYGIKIRTKRCAVIDTISCSSIERITKVTLI